MRWGWSITIGASLYGVAHAVQLELTRGELCELSEKVVVGEVSSTETRWADVRSGAIERSAWISVALDVKGQKADTVEVILPGGSMGELSHWVEHTPRLIENGRYLLFLSQIGGRWFVTGGEQGAVRITPQGARIGETQEEALLSAEACRAK